MLFSLAIICMALSCTERDSVVLLQTGGQLEVTTQKATVGLEKPLQGMFIDKTGSVLATQFHPTEIATKFGELATSEPRTHHYTLYFSHGVRLTKPSEDVMQMVGAVLRQPDIQDIQIMGYTDHQGTITSNTRLALRRARYVQQRLLSAERMLPMQVRGEGQQHRPLSADEELYEPRNRRVEIVVHFK